MGGMTDNECKLLMELVKSTSTSVEVLRGEITNLRRELADFRKENESQHSAIWNVIDDLPCRVASACPTNAGGFWKMLGRFFRLPS